MIHAVIDIGSNTVRLSVFKVKAQAEDPLINLFNEKETVGLAGYKEDKRLTEEGIQSLIEVLKEFKYIIDNFDEITEVTPFATASLRNVENTEEVLARVKEEVGFDILLLSGKEEAEFSFAGAYTTFDKSDRGILLDIGGGSTEIISFKNEKIIDSASLDIGSLSVFKDYVDSLFITREERKVVDDRLLELLQAQNMERDNFDFIYALGGSARATLRLYNRIFQEDPLNDMMKTDDLKTLRNYMLDLPNREKMNLILKVKADRIHTLLPGLCILYRLAKYFHAENIKISQRGIREGIMYSRLQGGKGNV